MAFDPSSQLAIKETFDIVSLFIQILNSFIFLIDFYFQHISNGYNFLAEQVDF